MQRLLVAAIPLLVLRLTCFAGIAAPMDRDKTSGCVVEGTSVGNFANPATGNIYQPEVDYVNAAIGINFIRHYNNQFAADVDLGYGWTSPFHQRLEIDGDNLRVRRGSGHCEPFTRLASDWQGGPDTGLMLSETAEGFTLTLPDGSMAHYDLSGRLQAATDTSGQRTAYAYDAIGNLAQVSGPFGHMLALDYDARGRTTQITEVSPDGVTRTTQYFYDAAGQLIALTTPDGDSHHFRYDRAYRLRARIAQINAARSLTTLILDVIGNLGSKSDGTIYPDNPLYRLSEAIDTLNGIMHETYDVAEPQQTATMQTSQLWGSTGESWMGAAGRLPDWSYVGYRGYEPVDMPLPSVPIWRDMVTHYGVDNTGVQDATAKLQQAVSDFKQAGLTTPQALFFPAGTYKLSNRVVVDANNLVLKGAGQDLTTLLFTQGTLAIDLVGDGLADDVIDRYLGPGLIEFGKRVAAPVSDTIDVYYPELTLVTHAAPRGSRTLHVGSTAAIAAGDWLLIQWDGEMEACAPGEIFASVYNNALWREFRNGDAGGAPFCWASAGIVNWISQVERIDSSTELTLGRGVPFKIDPLRWHTIVRAYPHSSYVSNVGIEDLAFDFPGFVEQMTEEGEPGFWHHDANGTFFGKPFNDFRDGHEPIEFNGVRDGWIKNVKLIDVDSGIILRNARHVTVSGVTFHGQDKQGARLGHYGVVAMNYSQDVLVEDVDFTDVNYIHSLSQQNTLLVVYSRARGDKLDLDSHGMGYAPLFTDVETPNGERLVGSTRERDNNGAFYTFWNVRSLNNRWGDLYWGTLKPLSPNFVGIDDPALPPQTQDIAGTQMQPWVERWPGEHTWPRNIYEAQRMSRFSSGPLLRLRR